MPDKQKHQEAVSRTLEYLDKAGIVLTEQEKQNIEITDFGLGELEQAGLEISSFPTSNLPGTSPPIYRDRAG